MKITIEADTTDPMDMEMLTRMFAPVYQVTVTDPAQHIKDVAQAAAALKNRPDLQVPEMDVTEKGEVVPKAAKKTTRKKKTTSKKKKEEEPAAEDELDVMPKKQETSAAAAVVIEDTEPAPPAESETEPPSAMTLKEVRDAFTQYVKKTNLETAGKLLEQFEVKKVSDLDASRYVEFFEAIRG